MRMSARRKNAEGLKEFESMRNLSLICTMTVRGPHPVLSWSRV